MKKSLSILLSFALVFGLFASMASAADTELTTAQKYQALVDKGVLKGNPDGDARLGNTLNRAEYATIAIAIAGLAEEKPATATFSDVNSKQWWYGAIEAAAKAGLVDGVGGGKFDPRSDVTIEQVIKVAVQAAGATPVEGAEVEGASAWAGPYIQAALDAGLIAAGLDYKASATRGQTIDVGYAVYDKLNPTVPAKVSVTSAKATNYDEVTVTLDKAVDTEKATLTLKRGTATVATTAKWSEDGKTVVLSLTSAKISEADYSVTLAGIAAEEIATATASFKGENEKVTKLEFVTTSDEIAQSLNARVKLRAENQYGKLASFNAANYTVNADTALNATVTKNSEGYLIVKLDTATYAAGTGVTPGLSQIPIYVYSNDNHLTAFKTFKLGFKPFVTKSEVGEFKYDNGKSSLVNVGDTATAHVAIYDQYGNPMGVDTVPPAPSTDALVFNNNVVPYAQNLTVAVNDFNSDGEFDVRVSLDQKTDKAQTHTLTLYVGSSSSQASFDIGTSKVATTIEFQSFDGTLAYNDSGKLVTFDAFDANGDKLTATEIAENAKNTAVPPAAPNTGRFNLTASGVSSAEIVTVGPDKGKIRLGTVTAPKNSYVFLTLSILSPNANSIKTLQIPVADVRVPASVAVVKKPHVKAVLGATSAFEFQVRDQYGDKIGTSVFGTGTDTVTYQVRYELIGNANLDTVTGNDSVAINAASVTGGAVSSNFANVNSEHVFDTKAGAFGLITLKATLEKAQGAAPAPADFKAISSPAAVSIETVDHTKTALNYSIGNIASIYASLDNKSLYPSFTTEANFFAGKTAKNIELTVKDNAGNSVAYPGNSLTGITTSNSSIVKVSGNTTVLGAKAGEATVTAVVYKADGQTATLTANVTVKNDAIVADSVSAKGSVKEDPAATTPIVFAPSVNLADLMEAKVKDNYGVEYTAADARGAYSLVTGLRYTVSETSNVDVVVNPTTGAIVSIAPTATNYQFVVTVTTPNGKTASTVFFAE